MKEMRELTGKEYVEAYRSVLPYGVPKLDNIKIDVDTEAEISGSEIVDE